MSRSPEQPPRWPRPPRSRPLALRAEDFDALARRRPPDLQRRMDAWAGGVVDRLADLGIDATILSTSQEREAPAPAVRLALRGASAGATRLVLAMDGARVRAGLELPAVQARAARARLSDPARALELATALEALPEQFTMGASGDAASAEAPRATADDMRALLDRVERESATMWIGWSVPRELALEHAALLDEQLADSIVALAQIFALLGADAADRAGPGGGRDARSGGKGRRSSGGHRGEASEPRREDEGRDRSRPARTRARGRDREREPEAEGEAEPEPVRDSPVPRRVLDAKLPKRPGSRRRPWKGSPVVIERGARVHVLEGPFSGKVGVVHELDGKGGARVMLGLLAVRLEVGNLIPADEGRGRPRLSSSHRKPIPARS
jgi:hypothetical protein